MTGLKKILIGLSLLFLAATPVSAQDQDFYVQPIPNLEPGFFGQISPDQIRRALVGDNYRAYCATDEFRASPQVFGAFDRYQELGGDTVILKPEYGLGTAVEAVRVPLVRNEGSISEIDWESYIGNPLKRNNYPHQGDTTLGSAYKQLSAEDLCKLQVTTLNQIKYDCDQLERAGSCSLYQPIEGTGYTTRALISAWADSGLTCEDVATGGDSLTDAQLEIVQAMNKLPLFPDKYRIAFLVQAVRQRPGQGLVERLFNFLTSEDADISEGDAVDVVALVVPSSFTKNEEINDKVNFHGLEEKSLLSDKDLKNQEAIYQSEKVELREKTDAAAAEGFSDDQVINCKNCNVGDDREIKTALSQFINGSPELSCGGIINETAEQIDISGAPQPDSDQEYKISSRNAFETYVQSFLQSIALNFLQAVVEIGGGKDLDEQNHAAFRTYIVVPYYEEEVTEFEVLTTSKDQEAMENLSLPTNIELNNIVKTDESKRDTHDFFDPDACTTTTLPDGTVVTGDCQNSFGVGIGGNPIDDTAVPVIPRLARKAMAFITALFNPVGSAEHTHATSTYDNNERFLLGSGLSGDDDASDSANLSAVAQCQGVTAGGGNVQHKLQSGQIIGPGEVSAHIGECTLYDSSLHNIPDWNADVDVSPSICEDLYGPVACYAERTTGQGSLIQNPVNAQGEFVNSGSQTACEFVVKELNAAGINSKLGLAIWIEESGGSLEDGSAASFGVITLSNVGNNDLAGQVNGFANTLKNRSSWEEFLLRFSEGLGKSPGDPFCTNPWFVGQIKDMYEYVNSFGG